MSLQMSPFEFVTIFYSVVVGLALSHILTAVSDLFEIRERVKPYWLNTVWVLTVIVWTIFAWWGLWDLVYLESWNYAGFWLVVTNLAAIYFVTTLVLPQAVEEGSIDLEEHYYSVHRAFFSIVAYTLYTSVLMNHFLFGEPMIGPMTIMPFIVGSAALAAVFTRNEMYHKFIGVFFLLMFIAFQLLDTTVIHAT